MPVRNAAATVGRAMASIGGQSFSRWELVAVDDGSSDATGAILAEWARRDPRVRVITTPPRGLVAALNTGLDVARGAFVARMDADDESHPDRLAEQVQWLEANPAVGVVGCLVEFGGDRRASEGYGLHVDWINSLVSPEQMALSRFIESPLAHPSVMFRRELVAQYGGYRDGDFPEDYELWLRWLDAGVRMAKVPRVLLTWHDGPARLSRSDPRYDPEAFFRVKAEWIARWLRRTFGPGNPARNPGADPGFVGPELIRPIWIWGAGRPTRKRAAWLESHGVKIAGYIDVDARKATRAIGGTGAPVIPPADLPPPEKIFVLGYVSTRGARELIRAELKSRRYVEGRDFLMGA